MSSGEPTRFISLTEDCLARYIGTYYLPRYLADRASQRPDPGSADRVLPDSPPRDPDNAGVRNRIGSLVHLHMHKEILRLLKEHALYV